MQAMSLLFAPLSARASEAAAPVRITVDPSVRHQKIDGFGTTVRSLVQGQKDPLLPEQRARVIEALFKDVGLSVGNLHIPNFERERNDDGDPQHLNRGGFDLQELRTMKESVVDPAMKYGRQNFYLEASIDMRNNRGMLWLRDLRHRNYEAYLEECAEHIFAAVKIWRDEFGFASQYVMPFNEALTGNRELAGGSTREVIDIIKRAGARLRRGGLGQVRFVVAGEETERASFELAKAILEDPETRPLVGVIAYHPYPYGSPYASVPNILRNAGRPLPEMLAIRAKLRDLGRKYSLPVWMTEVSHMEVDALSFDAVLGRAIHIHDEFVYADASAFFGMHAMWDSWTHKNHFAGRKPGYGLFTQGDTIVLIEKEVARVHIVGTGYAIGHYARWIGRAARRVEATTSDSPVLVTAFHDETRQRLTLVLINSRSTAQQVAVSITSGTVSGSMSGEESTSAARWKALPAAPGATSIERRLLPRSVTTIALDGFALPKPAASKPKAVKPKAKPKPAKHGT